MRLTETTATSLKPEIIATLSYFNLFKHPLTADEIFEFLAEKTDREHLQMTLNKMVDDGSIYHYEGYYLPENKPEYLNRRKAGAERAMLLMKKAAIAANVISKFPFVKSVCISGSLSKGYANEKSDIDFFIITEARRLWICRTLLHIYKKFTFLWGSQHSYCMNYFIDESMLCLEEQNKFTATELATMKPVYNLNVHSDLIAANSEWLAAEFPNKKWQTEHPFSDLKYRGGRHIVEFLINRMDPEKINTRLMNLTDKMWRMKWNRKGYPSKDYDLAMKTRWYVSKNHPLNYQKKILAEINKTNTTSSVTY
jgi:predicted nucleotidyltransferase